MIDYYLLEELVTFADNKTLAKTAEKLMVTQPTITRGMQKLEEELGVTLFYRQPNKITLTKTGEEAVRNARQLLAANREFVTKIQNYDQSHQKVRISAVAPGPLYVADLLTDQKGPAIEVQHNGFVPAKQVADQLLQNQTTLIINNEEVQTDQVESLYLGQEQLYVNLDQFMYLASQQSITFSELKGLSFVVYNDIGPWKDIIQDNIPDAKFLYQAQRDALAEITRYSNFPFFSSSITSLHGSEQFQLQQEDRVTLPITDEAATMTFYATYLKSNKKILRPVIKELAQNWPKLKL